MTAPEMMRAALTRNFLVSISQLKIISEAIAVNQPQLDKARSQALHLSKNTHISS